MHTDSIPNYLQELNFSGRLIKFRFNRMDDSLVTNIRNTNSLARLAKPENRRLVPLQCTPEPNPETKKKDVL